MLTRHRRTTAIACLLFCTQAVLFSKCGLGQVGIAWDPSYAATNFAECGSNACGGGALGLSALRGGQYNPLDFDSAEPNDEQRRVLFEYYNANRYQAFSADGVEGWDTTRNLNPLKIAARRRQSDCNLASCLGAGTMQVDPFLKRIYGGTAAGFSTTSSEAMSSPLSPQPDLPATNIPADIWPPTTNEDPNPVYDLTEEIDVEPIEEFPTPEEYKDVASEFEWDESLLDELPELNDGAKPSAIPGNPLPPTSTDVDDQGNIQRRPPSRRLVAKRSREIRSTRTTQILQKEISPLQAAIQLQSATEKKRGPVNALEAAIAIESQK